MTRFDDLGGSTKGSPEEVAKGDKFFAYVLQMWFP
jgi:hypothetical protein